MIRAGILITGTEVLSGSVRDRNGPWLSQRLREQGVDVAQICTVGDRARDIERALSEMERARLDLILTSGGLGPTADDLTVDAVARWRKLPLVLDDALQARIAEIVSSYGRRAPTAAEAMAAGNRKQAIVPQGATVLGPAGTAPGLVIRPPGGRHGPLAVVLPGPPLELMQLWFAAMQTSEMRELLERIEQADIETMRLFGISESQLAETLRQAEAAGIALARLEITTCQHRGELEVTTRVPAGLQHAYSALKDYLGSRHDDVLFSTDGSSVDDQVALMLSEHELTLATAESCTGGMLAARLTDLPGASTYLKGAVVAYSNEVKEANVGVPAALIEAHGAVSAEVAGALAEGARRTIGADVGVGVTGIAGPSGGSARKPVGLVWVGVAGPGEAGLIRSVQLPGSRWEVRERAVTVAMHLLRRALRAGA